MGTWVNWAKKVPQVRDGRKLQFFLFFEKFSKMKKILIVSLQDNWNIQIHLVGWKMGTWVNWTKKSSPDPRWEKTSIFFIFWKVFENEENPHSLTPGQLKYTNSLSWMKNGHMSELNQKKFPRSAVGENFNFFNFLKSFRKWRKSLYSHSRTTKIYKFTHLDGKWAHNWAKKVPQVRGGRKL